MPKRKRDDYTEEKNAKCVHDQEVSPLPFSDDGWLGAFEFVDHDLLNNISRISTGAFSLSEMGRGAALTSEKAVKLTVTQVKANHFRFHLLIRSEERLRIIPYILNLRENNMSALFREDMDFKKYRYGHTKRECKGPPQKQTISREITNRARKILQRFDIKEIFFNKVSIDDNILQFAKATALGSPSFESISFRNCEFDNDEDTTLEDRLKSILLQIKPRRLSLNNTKATIDNAFLQNLANNVPSAYLSFIQPSKTETLQPACGNFLELLPKFASVNMPLVEVNADGLLAAVKARLRSMKRGQWTFHVSRPLELAEVEKSLEPDMKMLHVSGNKYIFGIKPNNVAHKVTVKCCSNELKCKQNAILFYAFFDL